MDSWEQMDLNLTFTSIDIKVSSTYVNEISGHTLKLHENEFQIQLFPALVLPHFFAPPLEKESHGDAGDGAARNAACFTAPPRPTKH